MTELLAGLSVSRETHDRLRVLDALLVKWNPAINLVSRTTVGAAWQRHILDSVQLFRRDPFGHWADLGSGGGFPGLVIAVVAQEKRPEARITLVESDQRKCAFLREAARQIGVTVHVEQQRIETLAPLDADILSARALAPLDRLLGYAHRHLAQGGVGVFPKGAGWRVELDAARKTWIFDVETVTSMTDPEAVVLTVKGLRHV